MNIEGWGTQFAKNKPYPEALRWALLTLADAQRHLEEAGETESADYVRRLRARLARKRRNALATNVEQPERMARKRKAE